MTFAPVKSDPYKAGLPRRRPRRRLWSSAFWRRLCRQAEADDGLFDRDEYPISDECLRMIVEANDTLEGDS